MKFSATSSYFGALLIVLQGASAVLAAPTAGGKEYSYLDAYKPHSHAERSELSKREPCTASRKLKRKAW